MLRVPNLKMNRFRAVGLVALVAGLALVGGAQNRPAPAAPAWERMFVGETKLSLTSPTKLSAGEREVPEDNEDWVVATTDYSAETDDYYLQITHFEAKAGITVDAARLVTAQAELVKGLTEGEEGSKVTEERAFTLDGVPARYLRVRAGKEPGTFIAFAMMVGEGSNMFLVQCVGFPDSAKSLAESERIVRSVRYKKPL